MFVQAAIPVSCAGSAALLSEKVVSFVVVKGKPTSRRLVEQDV
jgi:hypothetical protein